LDLNIDLINAHLNEPIFFGHKGTQDEEEL